MDLIKRYIESQIRKENAANIIISGISCSGKTTLAKRIIDIAKELELSCITLSQDDYFKNIDEIPKTAKGFLADSPNAFYSNEYIQDCIDIFKGKSIFSPEYDKSKNIRISKSKVVNPAQINIFEGLHTINLLKDKIDGLFIFLNVDYEECLNRRILRDKNDWDLSKEVVTRYWNDCIIPISKLYIEPQKKDADILMRGDEN